MRDYGAIETLGVGFRCIYLRCIDEHFSVVSKTMGMDLVISSRA